MIWDGKEQTSWTEYAVSYVPLFPYDIAANLILLVWDITFQLA